MFSSPKELPHLASQGLAGKRQIMPTAENMTIRTESPINEVKKSSILPKLEIPRSQDIIIAPPPKVELSLPVIEDDMPNFDEAIKSIHRDIMKESHGEPKKEEYYQPKELGEGYFSEIRHYLKNKDVNEIVDDIIKKDFLTGMKDYHDLKAKGKPYYLHSQDLKQKLERRMDELMQKEEKWHELTKDIEEQARQRNLLEKEIDSQGQELRELFRMIKTNQILEKEAKPEEAFLLRGGQKLKSLNDLRKALSYMDDSEFQHHVSPERNDFAAWAEKTLELPDTATKIGNAKNKEELANILKNL
jgi:hypothetical protein